MTIAIECLRSVHSIVYIFHKLRNYMNFLSNILYYNTNKMQDASFIHDRTCKKHIIIYNDTNSKSE